MKNKRLLILIVFIVLFLAIGGLILSQKKSAKNLIQSQKSQQEATQKTTEQPPVFNKNMFALDKPGSPWWIVNKKRALPAGYVPPDLNVPNVKLRLAPTAEQMQFSKSATTLLEEMFVAAKAENVGLVFGSGYRSEAYQKTLYNGYVAQNGQAYADRLSARPGVSEHQTGLAFDATASNGTCHLEACFADTPEGKWLALHGYEYGFIIRYPQNKELITGYDYEPWHLRYVGRELAGEMHKTSVTTLEEFFNLPAASNY